MGTLRHLSQMLGGQPESFVLSVLARLVVASVLGGLIGLEREFKRRPAGLRTNMFICFGAAMFTILSDRFATQFGGDHARIAAQIIPGIGFIGAGSILHERGSVSGLTTAATIFVVAAVGMAAGGGFYLFALFATIVILGVLLVLGFVEERLSLKSLLLSYQVVGDNASDLLNVINATLEREHHGLHGLHISDSDGHRRVQFTVDATAREHKLILDELKRDQHVTTVHSFGAQERD
jgi:putative Mg2+ transporter-C (MgtC) family protein